MNTTLLDAWRKIIRPNDTVINLGDIFFKTATSQASEIIHSLPGKKILILGNHDRRHNIHWWQKVGFDEVYPHPIIYKKWYILSHEQVFLNEMMPYINIHGHSHQYVTDSPVYVNVSVEQTEYKPVLFDEIIEKYKVK